ncbi:hypothetical protein CBL_02747 [Carabus blaptoides fortunei]
MANKPKVIARAGEFLRLEAVRPDYCITSIVGTVECSHTVFRSQLQLAMEPENTECIDHKRCTVWLKNPGWSIHQSHVVMEARDEGGFWQVVIPNYTQYVYENKMLIKAEFHENA